MRRWLAPAFIWAMLIFIGVYFFPFGQDIVFAVVLDYAGGDFWLAWAYLYLACGAFILMGYVVIRHGYGALAQPYVILPVAVVALIILRVV